MSDPRTDAHFCPVKQAVIAACSLALCATVLAQTAADDPRIVDDNLWRTEPWLDRFVPEDFIHVKPHVALVGSDKLEVVWLTQAPATGWTDWSQDGGQTWQRAWTSRHGIRDTHERIHRSVITGFDPATPVRYRVVSRPVVETATGHIRYAGETNLVWNDRKAWKARAARRLTDAYEGVEWSSEGTVNPLGPADGRVSIIMFNDVHHGLGIYTNLIRHAGPDVTLAVFNGDIIDHSRSEDDIVKFVNAPMSFVGDRVRCATRYVRGNHELVHAAARQLGDYLGLQDGQFYGAVTLGGARVLFLDTGSCAPDDSQKNGRDEWDFDGYLAEEIAWLKRELASDAWKQAAWRLVFAHVPPTYSQENGEPFDRQDQLFSPLFGANVTAFFGGHLHTPGMIAPCPRAPYPVFVGGTPSVAQATLIRCDIRGRESLSVRTLKADGRVLEDVSISAAKAAAGYVSVMPRPVSEDPGHWWPKARAYRHGQKANNLDADLLFIGDSITHYWEAQGKEVWPKYFSGTNGAPFDALQFGYEGDETGNVLWRLQNGEIDGLKPRAIVLLIGANNIGHRAAAAETPDDTVRGIRAIVDELRMRQPQAKIVLHPILPRGQQIGNGAWARGDAVNQLLPALCDEKTVFLLDFNAELLNADGSVNQKMLHDFLHPSAAGYELWATSLVPFLNEILGK